jgi:hypothetical protein
MVILKTRKASYTEAMANHTISLSPFLVKVMEKQVERHVRNTAMRTNPLNQNHFPYQAEKFTETALHNIIKRAENAVQHKEIALGAFLT